MGKRVVELTVPKKSAATWEMKEGDLCRITVIEGSQVGFISVKAHKHCNSHNSRNSVTLASIKKG
jgi:uncharacterized protein YcgI (DUF1989 family)